MALDLFFTLLAEAIEEVAQSFYTLLAALSCSAAPEQIA